MKIGLLAYHAACNFGAFLQLLSTIEYIKKNGDEPRVINWIPNDLQKDFERKSQYEIRQLYSTLRMLFFPLTDLCVSAQDVAKVIEKEHINAIIIGSDAVTQHHPLRGRIHFPCKRILRISHPTSEKMFPNCFWGEFNNYLKNPVPIAVISGSSQDSKYYYIKGCKKREMKKSILAFKYMSVRDDWTQKMITYLTDNEFVPSITPDPVFAFNRNAGHLLPTKADLIKKFRIPENYIILSFREKKSVTQHWIDEFQKEASIKGFSCVKLPYADASAFGNISYSVGDLVSPLEWFALIRYSKGYIGNNMHPIVTCISNGIPFYSFDNYGISEINGTLTNGESSKIYHLLKTAGFLENRIFINRRDYAVPEVSHVLSSIIEFDVKKENTFADLYYANYLTMMKDAYLSITN